MRAISMRLALLRRNSTSLTARSKRAAGLYAGAPRACEARGENVRTAGRPIVPAAAINLRRGRRMKGPLSPVASRGNELIAAIIIDLGQGRSRVTPHRAAEQCVEACTHGRTIHRGQNR